MGKKLKTDVLFSIAHRALDDALRDYAIPGDDRPVLGMGIDGDERTFQYYITGKRPEDAIFVARLRMNVYTGDVYAVEVLVPRKGPQ